MDRRERVPVNGLDNAYLSVGGPLAKSGWAAKANWLLAFHDFQADHGSADYGQEWNGQLVCPLAKGLTALLKYADYRRDSFARDTRKLWLHLEFKR